MPAPLFASVRQVCTVVDDFEATIGRLVEHLGIGPFRCWYFRPPVIYDTTFRGQPAEWTMKLGITWLDDVQYEVIQPMEGASLYREHLKARGRGVQHVLMGTGEVRWEDAVAILTQKAHPLAQSARINPPLLLGPLTLPALPNALSKPANLHFGYVDAEATLRTCIEVTRYPLGFSERFALRAGKPEFCIPDGQRNFERPLPNLLVRRVVKVGIVTRDLDAVVRAWEDLAGNLPWHLFDASRKEPEAFSARVGWGLVGDVLIEVVQPTGGKSPFQSTLVTRGEGVAWVGFESAAELGAAKARCEGLGYAAQLSGSLLGDHESVYFGSRGALGTDIELYAPGQEALPAAFARLAQHAR